METQPARVIDEILAPVMPLIVEEAQKLSTCAGTTMTMTRVSTQFLFSETTSYRSDSSSMP